jgi:hypothetical protein
MATVTIMCPQTGKQVSTGVATDRAGFKALAYSEHFAFYCWLCGRHHEWSKRWATLAGDSDRAGALAHAGMEIQGISMRSASEDPRRPLDSDGTRAPSTRRGATA